jgi:hypothetical protein
MKKWLYLSFNAKYPLFLSDLNETWIFSTNFRKVLKYEILCISVQWGPSCFRRTSGRTDMTMLITLFAILRRHLRINLIYVRPDMCQPIFRVITWRVWKLLIYLFLGCSKCDIVYNIRGKIKFTAPYRLQFLYALSRNMYLCICICVLYIYVCASMRSTAFMYIFRGYVSLIFLYFCV